MVKGAKTLGEQPEKSVLVSMFSPPVLIEPNTPDFHCSSDVNKH